MRSRYLSELTTPEIEQYLSASPSTAILPVGSVEMHGPHMPTGTDTLIAAAVAVRLAESANGLVLPAIQYTWAGATDGFAGTFSMPPELARQTVEAVVLKAHRMGFGRQVLLSHHGGNRCVLELAVRRTYEMHHIPVAYIRVSTPTCPQAAEALSGLNASAAECSMMLGALDVLGKGGLYREQDLRYDDPGPPHPQSGRDVRAAGALVGQFNQDVRQHVAPSVRISREKGVAFIDAQVRGIAEVLDHLERYCGDVRGQANRGWWRGD